MTDVTLRPLRVAMIIQAYLPHVGGAERQLAALAPLLRERNVDITIITRRYDGWSAFDMIDGTPVHRLPIPGPKVIAALSFTLTALPLFRRLQPDVIHAHELLSPTTTAIAAKRLFGTPVVAKVLRGGKLGDIAKLHARRTGKRRLELIRRYVDALIAISQEIDAELEGAGIPAQRRIFIPNGVDTDRFAPLPEADRQGLRSKLDLPSGPLVTYSGRLVPEKRVDQLIGIWPAVRQVHPQAQLLILGTGEDETALIKQAGNGVVFTGRVDDVLPYLQVSDIFVLPSATEGLSNSMLEAMAVGVPPIVTQVGGATDLVEDGQNGRVISPDRPADLLKALTELLADKSSQIRFGRQARERILRDYTLDAVADRLRELYERVNNAV